MSLFITFPSRSCFAWLAVHQVKSIRQTTTLGRTFLTIQLLLLLFHHHDLFTNLFEVLGNVYESLNPGILEYPWLEHHWVYIPQKPRSTEEGDADKPRWKTLWSCSGTEPAYICAASEWIRESYATLRTHKYPVVRGNESNEPPTQNTVINHPLSWRPSVDVDTDTLHHTVIFCLLSSLFGDLSINAREIHRRQTSLGVSPTIYDRVALSDPEAKATDKRSS